MSPGKGSDIDDLKLTLERIKAQGKANQSEYHKELLRWTRNVDKRYAWVILFALWSMMCAVLGPYRIYGLIYARTTQEGVYTREEASMPISMIFTVENCAGPFVSIIVYYMSYRQSMLLGSILLALGNGLATISPNLICDVVLLGFVQGIGYAFIFMPFMEIINSYFVKYRNIALGLALCGGTISVFAWQPLFQWLLDIYPWRYSYLGVCMVCCINLIMVPLLKPNPKPKLQSTLIQSATNNNNNNNSNSNNSTTKSTDKNTLSRLSRRALTYQNSIRRQSTILIARPSSNADNPLQRQASVISVNPFACSVGLERKISRAITTSDQNSSACSDEQKSPIAKQASILSQISRPQENYETVNLSEVTEDDESEFDMSIVWEVLKTPAFHLIWYNELIYFWVFSIYCMVMVDYGQDRGCTKLEAESLLSFQSVGELLGRLVLTIFVDMGFVSNKNVVILVLFILAGLLCLVTQVSGIVWMASITVTNSAFLSLLYILLNGLLVDYLGERQVTIGYGMASCIGGILMSFRPQAVGYFRDHLGSYDPLMICLGAACALGGLLWIIEPLVTRACKTKSSHENDETQSQA